MPRQFAKSKKLLSVPFPQQAVAKEVLEIPEVPWHDAEARQAEELVEDLRVPLDPFLLRALDVVTFVAFSP